MRSESRSVARGQSGVDSMGDLVAFRLPATPRRRISSNGDVAEILFFTGVRYVPLSEHATVLKNAARQTRRAAGERRTRERVIKDQPQA